MQLNQQSRGEQLLQDENNNNQKMTIDVPGTNPGGVAHSPRTARFSNYLKQSKRCVSAGIGGSLTEGTMSAQKNGVLDISNISRDNIKRNTKNLMTEINDIDEEILALQGTLMHALKIPPNNQNIIQDSNLQADENNDDSIERTIELDGTNLGPVFIHGENAQNISGLGLLGQQTSSNVNLLQMI